MNPRIKFPGAAGVVPHDLGGVRLVSRAGDVALEDVSAIKATLAALPANADLSDRVKGVYDQGQIAACTCYSSAAMQSIFEEIEQGAWLGFDALECYHAVGGNGTQGVDPHLVLDYMKQPGLLDVDTKQRYRIQSYAFVRLGPQGQIDVVKAALAANRPAVLAMLLPADWGQGDGQSQGGPRSSSYHQVCLTGYDADRAYFVNSQGVGWGDHGFGSVPWSFTLDPEQGSSCYAYTAVDAADGANG
ncbi:MAG TPA: hypothetical protein VLC06_02450 [Polyangia bacterium]|jgi:hypothetical protein|nr:hypothetical protein [Polyangia bacterium]